MTPELLEWFSQEWQRIVKYQGKAPSESQWRKYILMVGATRPDLAINALSGELQEALADEAFAELLVCDEWIREVSEKAYYAEQNLKNRAYVDGSF